MIAATRPVRNREPDDVRRLLDLLHVHGAAIEVRILGLPGGVMAGWFDDMDQAAEVIRRMNTQRPKGVYVTLNPVDHDLLGRRANRVGPTRHGPSLTGDSNVVARRWLPLDFDPERPEGISASEEEHRAALERAEAVAHWLAEVGWPQPVRADSGNGAHLLYRIDLPNDQVSAVLVRRCLEAIAARFGGDGVIVDTGVFNASRIWKVYGTTARKGEDLPERPHRRASILAVPSPLEVVPNHLLEALADEAPELLQAGARRDARGAFDVDAFLERHHLPAVASPWQSGGRRWRLLQCPFSDAHTDGAYVVQFASGAVAAGCHHNSCTWTWRELRERFEPAICPSPHIVPPIGPQDPPLAMADLREEGLGTPSAGLDAGVWRGFFGRFRDWVIPTTDGAEETIFAGASVALGLALGRTVAVSYGRPLYPNVFALVVGPSGSVRKTTVLSRAVAVLNRAFTSDFLRITKSLGSAEGLLELFCDDQGDALEAIPGQRVLLSESEFTNILTKMGRSGTANILDVLISLFDGDDVTPRTRHRPISVRQPFLSMLASTTPENLQGRLDPRFIDSGFLPRCSIFWATAREPIAYPELPNEVGLEALATQLQERAKVTDNRTLVLAAAARDLWRDLYARYAGTERRMIGSPARMLTRIPEQVLRFALLYAVDADHGTIERDDLETAALIGAYFVATAGVLPALEGRSAVEDVERRVLAALKTAQAWAPVSRIHRLVSGRIDAQRLRQILDALVALELVERRTQEIPHHGRVTVYRSREDPLSHGHTVTGS
jgi:hypothetical protein